MAAVDKLIAEHRLKYKSHWRTKSNLYWFWRLFQEVFELATSLLGLHRHSPELELKQIASICANWIEYRKAN